MPQVTVTTTASPNAIPPNSKRKTLSIINIDSTNIIYLRANNYNKTTLTANDCEYQLGAGGTLVFKENDDGRILKSSFQAIASAGSPKMFWGEGVEDEYLT